MRFWTAERHAMRRNTLGSRQVGCVWCASRMSRREEEERFPEQLPPSRLGVDEGLEHLVEIASPECVVKGTKVLFLLMYVMLIIFSYYLIEFLFKNGKFYCNQFDNFDIIWYFLEIFILNNNTFYCMLNLHICQLNCF